MTASSGAAAIGITPDAYAPLLLGALAAFDLSLPSTTRLAPGPSVDRTTSRIGAHYLAAPSAGQRPAYNATGCGGHPSMDFDATQLHEMVDDGGLAADVLAGSYTVAIVHTPVAISSGANFALFGLSDAASTVNYNAIQRPSTATALRSFQRSTAGGSANTNYAAGLTLAAAQLHWMSYDKTATLLRVGKRGGGTVTAIVKAPTTPTIVTLGSLRLSTGASEYYTGSVGAMFLFPSADDGTLINSLAGYCTPIWGTA